MPAIHSVYFPDAIDTYWSASSYADNGGDVWMVEFLDGDVFAGSKAGTSYVRCVR